MSNDMPNWAVLTFMWNVTNWCYKIQSNWCTSLLQHGWLPIPCCSLSKSAIKHCKFYYGAIAHSVKGMLWYAVVQTWWSKPNRDISNWSISGGILATGLWAAITGKTYCICDQFLFKVFISCLLLQCIYLCMSPINDTKYTIVRFVDQQSLYSHLTSRNVYLLLALLR